jgi:predicted nucleotidyltransferase
VTQNSSQLSRTEDRSELAAALRSALAAACPGSQVTLRGSLATGTADEYSDIDLLWVVPDVALERCVATIAATLAPVATPVSVRSDPDFGRSAHRRLLFVRFADLPLFWRLDLEVRAASRAAEEDIDADNPAARGDEWSRPESAAMNAIAAVKAVRRGQPEVADGLLQRAFERLAAPDPCGSWSARVDALADASAELEPRLGDLAAQIHRLAADLL